MDKLTAEQARKYAKNLRELRHARHATANIYDQLADALEAKELLEAEVCAAETCVKSLESRLKEAMRVLDSALSRMDTARDILTKGNPTPDNNWGMLDTQYLRAFGVKVEEWKP